MMQEYKVLGVKVQAIPQYVVKETLHTFLNSDTQNQIVTVNPEFVVATRKDKKFLNVINQASLATIDGNGIVKALQFLGNDISLDKRLTGVDLTKIIIDLAIRDQLKVLFCLNSKGLTTVEDLSKKLKSKYPELRFAVADEYNALELSRIERPRLVLVGFGAPYQDMWIYENLTKMYKDII